MSAVSMQQKLALPLTANIKVILSHWNIPGSKLLVTKFIIIQSLFAQTAPVSSDCILTSTPNSLSSHCSLHSLVHNSALPLLTWPACV